MANGVEPRKAAVRYTCAVETPLTPLDFLRRARKLYAARDAVVDAGLRLSYAAFGERCERWAAALQALGVQPGDRVATLAQNTHQHLEQFYGIPLAGGIIVPMNYRLSGGDFLYMINHSGASVLCVQADFLAVIEALRAQLPSVRHFVVLNGAGAVPAGWLAYEALLQAAGPLSKAALVETDLISINYTSGTTSKPKGVMITHRNVWANCIGTQAHWPMHPGDKYLWTLPMFHANGWTFTWTVTAAGAVHVCLPRVDALSVYERIDAEAITHLCAAPTVLIGIANGPLAERQTLRRGVRVLTAGAPPAAATIARLQDDLGWNVTHIYGLTETTPFISICEALPEHATLTAQAQADLKARQGVELMTSGELRVVDATLADVPWDGTTLGEIVARGNTVMRGYYRDPEATALAFAGGWFHSGDSAVVHPDGYVEIRDRIKDVIISGGENISSIEVEGVLLGHPAVLEAAVVGMPHPKWGETPHAFVILRDGHQVTAAELNTHARAKLAHFKVPTQFHVVQELPKTATGKIQKFVLRGRVSGIVAQ